MTALIEHDPAAVDMQDRKGWPPLLYAASCFESERQSEACVCYRHSYGSLSLEALVLVSNFSLSTSYSPTRSSSWLAPSPASSRFWATYCIRRRAIPSFAKYSAPSLACLPTIEYSTPCYSSTLRCLITASPSSGRNTYCAVLSVVAFFTELTTATEQAAQLREQTGLLSSTLAARGRCLYGSWPCHHLAGLAV
jgi:hypothetical protein